MARGDVTTGRVIPPGTPPPGETVQFPEDQAPPAKQKGAKEAPHTIRSRKRRVIEDQQADAAGILRDAADVYRAHGSGPLDEARAVRLDRDARKLIAGKPFSRYSRFLGGGGS